MAAERPTDRDDDRDTGYSRSKPFAREYRERKTELDAEDINPTYLKHNAIDITYRTHNNLKTVRCVSPSSPSSYNEIPEGFMAFWDDGKKYAYNPEEKRLITVNRGGQNQTVATEEDLYSFEEIDYPRRAPVKGAVQTDVEATIYYRSPRSDSMQEVTIEVERIEGEAHRVSGEEVGTGRRIEASTSYERDIKSHHGTSETTLGKVARVEFPRGQRFTVDVEGLSEDKIGDFEDRASRKLEAMYQNDDVSVNVEYEEQMEWED